MNERVNEISWIRRQQTCPLYIWDLKIPWTWCWRKRGFAEKAWSEDTASWAGKLQIKVEQVSLSARLTRKDKVTLSCVNSMTSFRKTREVLLDWYLNDLLLEEKFVLLVMTPVCLKPPNFFEGNLRAWSEFRLSAICSQNFLLSIVLALKWYGSVMRTSHTKTRFWSSDPSITELKVNKKEL